MKMDDVDDLQGFQATCLETSLTISVLALDNPLFVDWKIVGKAIAAVYDFHFISFLGGGVGKNCKIDLGAKLFLFFFLYLIQCLCSLFVASADKLFCDVILIRARLPGGGSPWPLYKVSFHLGGSRGMGFWLRHAPSPSLAMPLWITFTRHWASWRKLSILVDP